MEINRYLRIYLSLIKRNILTTLSYSPISVFLELFVEIGYQIAFVVMIDLIYRNIHSLGGWSRYEMLFFVGLDMFVSELLRSTVFIGSLFKLPDLIRTGGLDMILTKPINSMFMITLGNPYISGLISTLPGLYLMVRSTNLGSLFILPSSLIFGGLVLTFGFLTIYLLCVVSCSLLFIFPDSKRIPRFTIDLVSSLTTYPLGVYEKGLERFLLYIFPLLFFTAVPFQIMMKGFNLQLIILSLVSTATLFFVARFIWDKSLKLYSSASS